MVPAFVRKASFLLSKDKKRVPFIDPKAIACGFLSDYTLRFGGITLKLI